MQSGWCSLATRCLPRAAPNRSDRLDDVAGRFDVQFAEGGPTARKFAVDADQVDDGIAPLEAVGEGLRLQHVPRMEADPFRCGELHFRAGTDQGYHMVVGRHQLANHFVADKTRSPVTKSRIMRLLRISGFRRQDSGQPLNLPPSL